MTTAAQGRSSSATAVAESSSLGVIVEIGGIPILLNSPTLEFGNLIERRYAGFLNSAAEPKFELEFQLTLPTVPSDEEARVVKNGSDWLLERGDFRAQWNTQLRRGWVRQSANPYSLDSVLRIVHSLILADEGSFLLHAASAIRNGKAFLFSGISGAGKTTMTRLAPSDANVLTDEISYVRLCGKGYRAYGTPFAGELARSGENVSAPVDTLYFLVQGPENRVESIAQNEAARALLRNILFFAHDRELVRHIFDAAMAFVSSVRVAKLIFTPDVRAWEVVG
jgi:hypothetical protein